MGIRLNNLALLLAIPTAAEAGRFPTSAAILAGLATARVTSIHNGPGEDASGTRASAIEAEPTSRPEAEPTSAPKSRPLPLRPAADGEGFDLSQNVPFCRELTEEGVL